MKKVIKSEALEKIEKVLGSRGTKKGMTPLNDDLYNRLKKNSVA